MTLENPEPRYTVELFPFLIILAGAGSSILNASVASAKVMDSATDSDSQPGSDSAAPKAEY